jgi:hypothetical protein
MGTGASLRRQELNLIEPDDIALHHLGAADGDIVQWALYTAISWNDDPNIPALEVAMQHPEVARYHAGWGRHSDVALEATLGDEFMGAAFARLFTDKDH